MKSFFASSLLWINSAFCNYNNQQRSSQSYHILNSPQQQRERGPLKQHPWYPCPKVAKYRVLQTPVLLGELLQGEIMAAVVLGRCFAQELDLALQLRVLRHHDARQRRPHNTTQHKLTSCMAFTSFADWLAASVRAASRSVSSEEVTTSAPRLSSRLGLLCVHDVSVRGQARAAAGIGILG